MPQGESSGENVEAGTYLLHAVSETVAKCVVIGNIDPTFDRIPFLPTHFIGSARGMQKHETDARGGRSEGAVVACATAPGSADPARTPALLPEEGFQHNGIVVLLVAGCVEQCYRALLAFKRHEQLQQYCL